jgi:predicted metalloprotease
MQETGARTILSECRRRNKRRTTSHSYRLSLRRNCLFLIVKSDETQYSRI